MAEVESLPPTTTKQQDITTAGQRFISAIWEFNQAIISVSITWSIIYCAVKKISSPEITNAFFLIVGFYFSRTNHAAIGGIGKKPESPYEGR